MLKLLTLMKRNSTLLKFVLIGLLFIHQAAFAATCTWNGSVSTDWNTAANWTGGVPASGDDVTIPVGMPRYPVLAAATSIQSIFLANTEASFTINVGAMLSISQTLSCRGSIQNSGTLNVNQGSKFELSGTLTNKNGGIFNSIIPVSNGAYGIRLFNLSTIINESGGTINATGASGVFIQGDNTALTMLSNSGKMTLTGGIEKYNNNVLNDACGEMYLKSYSNFYTGKIINQAGVVTNNGYLDIQRELTNNAGVGNFVNNGLIKIGGTVGTYTNTKLQLKNNPANTAFMTIGTGNDLAVEGIFTDSLATVSAGTYSLATNTFTPGTLPSGSQTLYVKVTGGSCTFIAPITYLPIPVFTSQYTDRNLCTGASEVLTLSATDAVSYQWQRSAFPDMSVPTNLTTTGGSTTIIGNSSFNNYYFRCRASNNTGSVFSTVFRVFVSPAVSTPTAVGTNKNNLCAGISASLSASCAVGTVKWYDQATGGMLLATGSPYAVSPSAGTTYYAACENTACFSSRVSQVITVVNAPASLSLSSPANDIATDAGTLPAGTGITAANKVEATGRAVYHAGKSIELTAGFEAKSGAVFQTLIQAVCTN